VAERVVDHGVSRRVHPAMVPLTHPLASVNGAMNAVFVEGVKSGPLMWLGQGAGGEPTATAVLGDVLDAARNRVSAATTSLQRAIARCTTCRRVSCRALFYLSVDVLDRPAFWPKWPASLDATTSPFSRWTNPFWPTRRDSRF
jgi:homoserine dehydrogenase